LIKYAVQLYTLRENCGIDFYDTLENVKKMGFEGVEFAGFYGKTSKEIKNKLDELSLSAVSSHVSLKELKENLEQVVSFHLELNCNTIVCPYIDWNKETVQDVIDVLSKVRETLKNHHIELLFHNHGSEFEQYKDDYLLTHILNNTQVGLELDVCWAKFAGLNPLEYIKEHKNEIDLIHLKDLDDSTTFTPVALGEGVIDVLGIVEYSKAIGLSWLIIENDYPKPDALSNLRKSMMYIKENIK